MKIRIWVSIRNAILLSNNSTIDKLPFADGINRSYVKVCLQLLILMFECIYVLICDGINIRNNNL